MWLYLGVLHPGLQKKLKTHVSSVFQKNILKLYNIKHDKVQLLQNFIHKKTFEISEKNHWSMFCAPFEYMLFQTKYVGRAEASHDPNKPHSSRLAGLNGLHPSQHVRSSPACLRR